MDQASHNKIVSFIWGIADDVLRDLYARGKYRDVILPMCVLRRLDAVLEPTKKQVLETKKMLDDAGITEQDAALCSAGSPTLVGSVGRVKSLRYRLILSDKTFRAVFRPWVDQDFMVFAMNSPYYRHQVEQAISGAEGMANNLPLSSLRAFAFAVPPADEAAAIAKQLDSETSGITKTISRLEREVDLLLEYRTRLISDVVTGQLDVREPARSLPDVQASDEASIDADLAAVDETDDEGEAT